MVRVRLLPGVDDGTPVHVQRLETRAPVPAGAGVGVSSRGWLRDNALDAHERSQTQWGATVSSVGDQGHPMAVQFGREFTDSPPSGLEKSVQIKRRLAF